MVGDEIEHHQTLFAISTSQTTAELLQEQDLGFGWPQHQHRINARQIDPFVEQVYRKDHLQPAVLKLRQGLAP